MKAKEIFSWITYLAKNNLTVTEGAELIRLHMGLDGGKGTIEQSSLYDKGFLSADGKLTSKALRLSFLKGGPTLEDEELAKQIKELFPVGLIPTSGKPARGPLSEMTERIGWFKTNYSYNDDVILKAAKRYVDNFEASNFAYMQTSVFFICKDDANRKKSSALASWCEMIEEKEKKTLNNFQIDV